MADTNNQSVIRSFEDRRVLITGGGRGLGRAIGLAMAERGAVVSVVGRTLSQIDATASDLRAFGKPAFAFESDLYSVEQSQELVARAAESMGGIDVLVNNAGGWGTTPGAVGPILDATVEGFDAVYNLNVRSPLFLTIVAAKAMINQGTGGCVLNIVSVDGLYPAPTEALYASAKAAVINLTGTLSYEFGSHGIRVNAIAPGIIETEMTQPWLSNEDDVVERSSFYPLNRIGQPADISAAAIFLCSDEASWVTGVTIPVAGGQYATSDIFRWVRSHNKVPNSMRI
jgi:NAD(P)-dependent dehydrogenase (short-subunit alcohol dehydrogenase family)